MRELPTVHCPHGRLIAEGKDGAPAVVCGAMEADQARGDRILEGAPHGVLVSALTDPSTFFGFCCGEEPAPANPDIISGGRIAAHYTCCPVYLAERERTQVMERLFASPEPSEDVAEAEHGPERLTEDDLEWLTDADAAA